MIVNAISQGALIIRLGSNEPRRVDNNPIEIFGKLILQSLQLKVLLVLEIKLHSFYVAVVESSCIDVACLDCIWVVIHCADPALLEVLAEEEG